MMEEQRPGQGGNQGQGGQGGNQGRGGGHGGHGGGHQRHHRRNRGQGQGGQHQRQGGGSGGQSPVRLQQRVLSEAEKVFASKTPIDPKEWLCLEKGSSDPSMRAMDLLCPIGKGTRGLIVAPPKAGKTTFLKQLSNAVAISDPQVKQYCLLVDERPEEVTDFKRSVPAEVVASSSDQSYDRHFAVADELFRRAVEDASKGTDVFLLLDSLTRLARVHNQFATGQRTMTGGLDSRAMETPRRYFGAARKLEEGGSLTILATILVDTGSRMDEVIFQEFKGTGNMELVLSRQAAEMRIFPAMKVRDSGTRKEEKLLPPDVLEGAWKLRRLLADKGDIDALKALVELMRLHKTNKAILASLR